MGALSRIAAAVSALASPCQPLALALVPTAILFGAASARAGEIDRWRPHVEEASQRFGVPVTWIEEVMRAESAGRTQHGGRPIRSHAGAIGLMQLMPATWAAMRDHLGLGPDPDDPRDNILAGTLYLRLMYERFGYPGLFGAYNAGPARYAAYLSGSRRLPRETVNYLAKVVGGVSNGVSGRVSSGASAAVSQAVSSGLPGAANQAPIIASRPASQMSADQPLPRLFVVARVAAVSAHPTATATSSEADGRRAEATIPSLFVIRKVVP